MSGFTTLTDLGPTALSHRKEMEEVKRQIGINHGYFDAWIYGFLENKKFNVEETVSKLHRRFTMEVGDIASYELTDFMRASLRKGIIQEIGRDKQGRVAFFVNTRRDFPESQYREQQRRTFDMFLSYGTRLRADNMRCQMVMLINQKDVSMTKNIDMSFQADMALRISKFYPGGVDKMYICNMGRMLSVMAKPIFKRLPAIVSDRIEIITGGEVDSGALLEFFDEDVLPVELGGKNDCDNQANWDAYAERIEKYFADLKRVVKERRLTIKEFELEQLGVDPSAANESPPGNTLSLARTQASFLMGEAVNLSLHSQHSFNLKRRKSFMMDNVSPTVSVAEFHALKTCFSDDAYLDVAPPANTDHASHFESDDSWRRVMQDFPKHIALFFLDELIRWRLEAEHMELMERYKLMSAYAEAERNTSVGEGLKGLNVQDRRWYSRIPFPLRALYQLLLLGVTLFNMVYFLFAFIFFTVFTADIMTTIFFGFFAKPSQFFPLNCVLTMAMIQGTSLCTRAADFIYAIYMGNVIPLFERLGSSAGTVAEVILFVVVASVQLVIFCIYAAKDSPLQGLQVSFATGWLSAALIVAVTHVFFFTGFFTSRDKRLAENRLATLPFFLALNFGGASEEADKTFMIRTSSFVICGIPMLISLLFGIGFLISRIVTLYVCTLVSSLTAAFIVNYYSEALSNSLSSSLMRITLWMMTTAWLFVTFEFGFNSINKSWLSTVVVATVLHGFFVILAFVCLKRQGNSWLLRFSFIIVLLYIFACWISSFPLVGYQMGLFCMIMLLHNVLNMVFAPRALTSIHAVFFVATAVLLLMMSCVLLGWYGTTPQHRTDRSLPSSLNPPPVLPMLELYQRYPVCTLRLGADSSISVTDLALLTELVMARNLSVLLSDFNTWFANRGIAYDGVVQYFRADGVAWELYKFSDSSAAETTILVLNNKYAHSAIVSMVAWIDSIALSPLSIFLPFEWVSTIVYAISFVGRMIPFAWHDLALSIASFVESIKEVVYPQQIILTGTGIAGGFASYAGVLSSTSSVVFAAPGLLHEQRKFYIEYSDYHKYVLAVGAYYGVLDTIGGQNVLVKQKMKCGGSAMYCTSMEYISTELLSTCADPYGRQHC